MNDNDNTNNEQNDLPVLAEESNAAETLTDVVAEPVADTDELPTVSTENEQA